MQQVKGVVARSKGAPVTIETINVPEPGPGEALVKVLTTGVCHTDLHYRGGGSRRFSVPAWPRGGGRGRGGRARCDRGGAWRPRRTQLASGLRRLPGCNRGEPRYCFNTLNATQKMTLEDGTELSPALGIGAFIEKTLVAAGQCTKVDPDARCRRGGTPRLRRHGRSGRSDQHRQRKRGNSVAVIGCGGVGVAAVAGAALAGAEQDHRGRHRRPEARASRRRWVPRTPWTARRPTPSRKSRL